VEQRLVRGDVLPSPAVDLVRDAHAEWRQAREHVELGEEQLGEPVHPRRVPQDDGVEPSRPPAPARRRPELLAPLHQDVAHLAGLLGRERPGAHARHVGLGHPDDPVDPAGPDAGRRERVPRHGVRRRHERIRPVVEVEQRALRSLEQHVAPVAKRVVDQLRRVGQVRPEPLGVPEVVVDDRPGLEREPSVDLREDEVLLLQDDVELLSEDLRVVQVLDTKADPGGLVAVRRPDAALRRAERVLPEEPLGHALELEVPRHDQVRVPRDRQPRRVDAEAGQRVDLLEEDARVDHDAVGNHRGDVRIQDPRGDQVEPKDLPLRDHRVPGVVAALVPDDEVHPVGQVVDDLALALVAPLRTEDDGGRHDVR
jgi:hypothetical protein